MAELVFETADLTEGPCQRYLRSLRKEPEIIEEPKSTKAKDRPSMRGRRSDMTKWKVRTPEMTDEEYQEAIRIHRNKLSAEWRLKNKEKMAEYMRKYRQSKPIG